MNNDWREKLDKVLKCPHCDSYATFDDPMCHFLPDPDEIFQVVEGLLKQRTKECLEALPTELPRPKEFTYWWTSSQKWMKKDEAYRAQGFKMCLVQTEKNIKAILEV